MKKILFTILLLCCAVISKAQTKDSVNTNPIDSAEVFSPIDEIPTFPGGLLKFVAFIEKNKSRRIKDKGRVTVAFVVEKDGSLTDIKVEKGLSPEADAETIRIIKKSPKWNPGMQKNIPVRVNFRMPVIFQ